jgi:hypothetical protein
VSAEKPRAGEAFTLTLQVHLLASGEIVHPDAMPLGWLADELASAGWARVIVERRPAETAAPAIHEVLVASRAAQEARG